MSEAETLAIESLFTQYARSTDLFISFHSYGHYLLHPWGHTRNMPVSLKLDYSLSQLISINVILAK